LTKAVYRKNLVANSSLGVTLLDILCWLGWASCSFKS